MRVNNADTENDTIAALHSGNLHIDIHRRPGINETVRRCEHSLRIQIPQNVLLCKQSKKRLPVLLVDTDQRITPCGFKEIFSMSLY